MVGLDLLNEGQAEVDQARVFSDDVHRVAAGGLPNADCVVLTIPHTPSTEGLFIASKFALMKDSALFINIGRGMTTKLDDLNNALRSGGIAGAALDVYEIEPLPADHPLWDAPNTILTPHIAAQGGRHLEERRFEIVLENFRHFAAGEPLRNEVDKFLAGVRAA